MLGVVVTISVILAFQSVNTIKKLSEENITKYKEESFQEKKNELENYVSVALNTIDTFYQRSSKKRIKSEVEEELKTHSSQVFNTIENFYKKYKNKLSEKELKEQIKYIVGCSKYGQSGYFWINDMNAVIVEHPIKPHLNGKNLYNFKDKGGTQLFKEFVDVCKAKGEGFVDYVWPKPGFEKPQPKVSYVKLFKPFNWVIGTGAYVDDVTSHLQKEALESIKKMRYGKSGYFWINDMEPKMIMHPIKPALNGKELSKVKDPNGVFLFNDMVNICQEKGGGLVKYSWPKPDKEKPQLKFSYVKKFDGWNWIVGTGAYVDDIEDKIALMKKNTNDQINSTILRFIIIAVVVMLVVMLLVKFITNNVIIKPITNFQQGIVSFFQYLNRETNTIERLDESSKDELGSMAKIVNENIVKTKNNIDEDRKVIDNTISVLAEFEKGDLNQRVDENSPNPALKELTKLLNQMGSNLEQNINDILKVLEQYTNYNYLNKVEINGKKEHLLKLANGVNALGIATTNMLIENKRDGLILHDEAKILLSNVNTLSTSSNEAAASLEQTAAALEEITSNISSTTNNIVQMANHANEVTVSVTKGQELANQTTKAMDNINNEVTEINEAITVIDQIAFQTNILSLNAAVEAATAGEAGKGFAVVAQEVRNLASRSAEAANQIKNLVENAKNKASNGKKIADEMIEGYTHLNESISHTIEIIADVETASKEQLSGIEQINSAIGLLDQQTQQNASVATQTQDIANATSAIADKIIEDANKKEFLGKDNVNRRKKSINPDYKGTERRTVEKRIHQLERSEQNTFNMEESDTESKKHKHQNQTNNIQPISSTTDDDEWASF